MSKDFLSVCFSFLLVVSVRNLVQKYWFYSSRICCKFCTIYTKMRLDNLNYWLLVSVQLYFFNNQRKNHAFRETLEVFLQLLHLALWVGFKPHLTHREKQDLEPVDLVFQCTLRSQGQVQPSRRSLCSAAATLSGHSLCRHLTQHQSLGTRMQIYLTVYLFHTHKQIEHN